MKLAAFGTDGRLKTVRVLPGPGSARRRASHRRAAGDARRAPSPYVLSAVTMTAELADLRPDRPAGVIGTSGAADEGNSAPSQLVLFAGLEGFVRPEEAGAHTATIASANWYATGAVLAHLILAGILVDIGSSTSDLIPFRDGRVGAHGFSDAERLASNELIYTGPSAPRVDGGGPRRAAQRALGAPDGRTLAPPIADVHLRPAARAAGEGRSASRRRQWNEDHRGQRARRLLRMVGQDLTRGEG